MVQFMRSGGITAEQRCHSRRYLGGLSGAIYAIRRDHGTNNATSKDIWVDRVGCNLRDPEVITARTNSPQ